MKSEEYTRISTPSSEYPYLGKEILCIKSYVTDKVKVFIKDEYYLVNSCLIDAKKNVVEHEIIGEDKSKYTCIRRTFQNYFRLITKEEYRKEKIDKIFSNIF